MANNLIEQFPVWGLLPKKETGVTNFLTKYPEYDGRGITIAIFDSGVDPGAPGLQVTSEGKPKVIQRFDCSGAGDVDTSTVVKATNNVIQGLSGRQLKVPEDWKNPSGDFHIGVKNAFDLYPSKLKERVEEQRKEKLWESQHKTALADATRNLQEFEAKHPGANLSIEDKLIKDDLEAQVSILNELDKKYSDIGPTFDCIVFHDGEMWRACVDTSESGQLANCKLLGEYSLTRDFTTIGDIDQFNFSINVHNNGNTLEIVGMCSGHGTHVACIASAYFPDCPEKNGIAPGAQIISLTIGDARLGSMETGTGLVRAMIKVMELHSTNPIHVINMSYGEHAHWSNAGRVGELMNEVVNKYGVVWVVSAGNHGPALCTVGTPPDISQTGLIGVGAYVSPDMMIAEYSLRQRMPDMPFTWSSRSPTIDGDLGVTVCAPGAAITSVPNFTLRGSQLMNGTSMASPHVAGAIGILLSGMLNRNLPYSPYSVKRAIENSAQFIDSMDPFAQGRGLLRVERAFEHLATYCGSIERDVRFSVLCANDSKGIHIRGGGLDKHKDLSVTVEPFFKDTDTTGAHAKINFSVKLALVSNAPYVQSPSHLDLMNMARAFSIRVDPSGLTPGVYLTSVDAYDVSCVEKGPLFRIPITIVKPIELDTKLVRPELEWDNVNFQPNTIQRHFIVVPELATWAVLRLKSLEKDKTGRFIVHCMQIQPKMSCKTLESQRLWNVTSQAENIHAFQVKSGLILEVVVAKYWANVGDINIQYSLSFHGVKPNNPCIAMHGGDGLLTIQLKSMRGEEIAPVVTLKNVVQPIRPVEAKITPLSSRDVIQPGRQIYELVLTYNFHVTKATEVVPNCPIFSDILYESEFESQMWFLFDTNKQVLATGDAYPSKYLVKLEKGDYTIKLQVRHDKKDLLEKYVDVLMLISQKLPSSISMDVYASQTQALLFGKKIMSAPVPSGIIVPIYIGPLSNDKTSKGAVIGQYLSGTITYAKCEIGKKTDIYPFKYILPEPVKKNGVKPAQNNNSDKDKTKWEEYQDAIRDFKTNWLAKLEGCEEANTLYEELKTAHPEHFSIYTNMLQSCDPWDAKHQLPQINSTGAPETDTKHLNKIITIADIVINSINQEKLLAYFGLKSDNRPDATKIKSEMEKQRLALLDASARKGVALCKLYMQSNCASLEDQRTDYLVEISNLWNDLLKFTDMNENKVIFFAMWHANVYKNYGRLLKMLLKYSEEKSSREVDTKIVDVCMQLKWSHCARYFEKAIPTKYPHAYRQF